MSLPHATFADLGGDGIRAERGAGFKSHRLVDRDEAFEFLRIRDVRQGPDELLYVLTDENPGAVLRIEPTP